MSDDHDHDHGHSHAPKVNPRNARAIGIAAFITGAFMAVEVAGGLISGSLALLADAGHMLTDFAALALAWLAFRLAQRPGDWKRSYGFDRFSVLVAFTNGLSLFVIAAWIVWEAISRIGDPHPVLGLPMLVVAIGGLIVNLVVLRIMQGADSHNLNVRAALLHVMGDLLGSVAAIVAALVIIATGWTPIDAILSIVVAAIIAHGGWGVVRHSAHILLQGTPDGLEPDKVSRDLIAHVAGLADVHHIHSWSMTQERSMMTLHAQLEPDADADTVRKSIKHRLADAFHISHATVEIESAQGPCIADVTHQHI